MPWLVTIISGVVVGIIVFALRSVRGGWAGFLSLIVAGVFGAIVSEGFFGYLLGITMSNSFVTGFRWDAVIWSFVGSALAIAVYESYLAQPVSRMEEDEPLVSGSSYTSQPTAHDYNETKLKKKR